MACGLLQSHTWGTFPFEAEALAAAADVAAVMGEAEPSFDPNWKLIPVGSSPVSPLAFTTPNVVICTAQKLLLGQHCIYLLAPAGGGRCKY